METILIEKKWKKMTKRQIIKTTRDFLNSLGFITYEREFIIENLATKYVQLATYHYTYFGNLRKQWYKNGNGKKYVSDRFTLNEKSLAYWFMCDGSAKRQGNVTIIHLATYGFDEKSNSNLLSELKPVGLKAILTNAKNGYYININQKESVFRFYDLISPYILDCFKYKIKEPKVILTKKQTITKFQNQLNNYLDYVKGFCYLGYSKRKKKYVLKMSKRTWWIRRTRKKMELQGRAE